MDRSPRADWNLARLDTTNRLRRSCDRGAFSIVRPTNFSTPTKRRPACTSAFWRRSPRTLKGSANCVLTLERFACVSAARSNRGLLNCRRSSGSRRHSLRGAADSVTKGQAETFSVQPGAKSAEFKDQTPDHESVPCKPRSATPCPPLLRGGRVLP